jgi:hypothetical protein
MSPAQALPVKELPPAGAEREEYLNKLNAESDVDAIPEIVARIGRAVDGEMRRGA